MKTLNGRTSPAPAIAGFTLIEMLMVIVALAILLPTIFLPFINMAKGAGTPTINITIGAVARKVMDEELARIDGSTTWPASGTTTCPTADFYCTGTTRTQPTSTILNGSTYSSTIVETFCDATNPTATPANTCTNVSAATASNYLQIWVTTTRTTNNGGSITIESIKTNGF